MYISMCFCSPVRGQIASIMIPHAQSIVEHVTVNEHGLRDKCAQHASDCGRIYLLMPWCCTGDATLWPQNVLLNAAEVPDVCTQWHYTHGIDNKNKRATPVVVVVWVGWISKSVDRITRNIESICNFWKQISSLYENSTNKRSIFHMV